MLFSMITFKKRTLVVYLKVTFNWAFCALSDIRGLGEKLSFSGSPSPSLLLHPWNMEIIPGGVDPAL